MEVGQQDDAIILRDSTRPFGGMLHYGLEEWLTFVRGVKAGEFDDRRS